MWFDSDWTCATFWRVCLVPVCVVFGNNCQTPQSIARSFKFHAVFVLIRVTLIVRFVIVTVERMNCMQRVK